MDIWARTGEPRADSSKKLVLTELEGYPITCLSDFAKVREKQIEEEEDKAIIDMLTDFEESIKRMFADPEKE